MPSNTFNTYVANKEKRMHSKVRTVSMTLRNFKKEEEKEEKWFYTD